MINFLFGPCLTKAIVLGMNMVKLKFYDPSMAIRKHHKNADNNSNTWSKDRYKFDLKYA